MIFSRAGFRALKFAYLVLFAGLGVAGFIVFGSRLYWQTEKKNDQQSQRALQDMRGRLNTAMRDREDLRGSEDTYKALVARGMFMVEQRFDLIEALATLKSRHQIVSLSYELGPQRPLRVSTGNAYAGVNLVASRVKLKIRAIHDGDVVSFLDEFPRLQRGFFPLDRCVIKRNIPPQATVVAPSPSVASAFPPTPARVAVVPSPTTALSDSTVAAMEAECSLEWITLQTKVGNIAAPPIASSATTGRPL